MSIHTCLHYPPFATLMLAPVPGALQRSDFAAICLAVAVGSLLGKDGQGRGSLIVDDLDLAIRAAIDNIDLAYMAEENAAPHLGSGTVARVLET